MSKPPFSVTRISDTLHLSECHDGFWLWDGNIGMNISMKAKAKEDALVEGLKYYQKRLTKAEKGLSSLQAKVGAFVSQFVDDESDSLYE